MLRNLLLLCLGITLTNARLDAQELITWHDDLNEARQVSQQYKVPILIHFYGDNCVPCKTLEKNVFTRPEVASTMQRYFVPVHINATQDRRAAAQYGVHSWPTDVFVAPDGKILTQGVCNQNAGAYLQNLQSVAIMNRDRNIMLAGNAPPAQTQPQTPASAAQPANPYAAPQANHQPSHATAGTLANSALASNATAAAPYGRLATTSLQQAAPGRDQAPTPYTNPSDGASPYAPAATASGLGAAVGSILPSPTGVGQTAHGQATGGLVGSGPLADSPSMTVPPATPGTSQEHKDANLPQSAQWQPGLQHPRSTAHEAAPTPGRIPSAAAAMAPALATAPSLPASAQPTPDAAPGPFTMPVSHNAQAAQGSVVQNRYYTQNTTGSNPTPTTSKSPAAQTVSARGAVEKVTSVAEPKQPASIPALSGYCPVALLTASQWIEGKPEHAVRHRGRVYFLSTEEAAQKFLAAPDSYCPVLSGYDPLILLREGALVEGSVYTGLKDATQNRIMLFSSPENKKYFQDNYDRLATDLDNLLKPTEPRTAATPAATLSR